MKISRLQIWGFVFAAGLALAACKKSDAQENQSGAMQKPAQEEAKPLHENYIHTNPM